MNGELCIRNLPTTKRLWITLAVKVDGGQEAVDIRISDLDTEIQIYSRHARSITGGNETKYMSRCCVKEADSAGVSLTT